MGYYTAKKNELTTSSRIKTNKSHDHKEERKGKTHTETKRHPLRGTSRLKEGNYYRNSQNGVCVRERRLGWGLRGRRRVLGAAGRSVGCQAIGSAGLWFKIVSKTMP